MDILISLLYFNEITLSPSSQELLPFSYFKETFILISSISLKKDNTKHLGKGYFIFRAAFAALITPVGFFSNIYLITLNWCNFVRKFR